MTVTVLIRFDPKICSSEKILVMKRLSIFVDQAMVCSTKLGICVQCDQSHHCNDTSFNICDSYHCTDRCTMPEHCHPDLHCNNSTGECVECLADEDCPHKCQGNKCVLEPQTKCQGCEDCPMGKPNCIGGTCVRYILIRLISNKRKS